MPKNQNPLWEGYQPGNYQDKKYVFQFNWPHRNIGYKVIYSTAYSMGEQNQLAYESQRQIAQILFESLNSDVRRPSSIDFVE